MINISWDEIDELALWDALYLQWDAVLNRFWYILSDEDWYDLI